MIIRCQSQESSWLLDLETAQAYERGKETKIARKRRVLRNLDVYEYIDADVNIHLVDIISLLKLLNAL